MRGLTASRMPVWPLPVASFDTWDNDGHRARKTSAGYRPPSVVAAKSAYVNGLIDLPELERRLEIALRHEQSTVADDLQRLGSAKMTAAHRVTRKRSGTRK